MQAHLAPTSGRRPLALLALGLTGLLAGCGGASTPDVGTNFPGSIVQDPSTGRFFIVDPSKGGLAPEMRVARLAWGRLVDVFGLDLSGKMVLMNEDFAMAPNLLSDGIDFLLESNPVTAQQTLTILRDVTDTTTNGGRKQYFDLLKQAEANLEPVFDNGLVGSGFFSMVPRNAVAVLQLDDLIDQTTLDSTTVRVVTGSPSVIPYEARLLLDRNHGDLAEFDGKPGLEFYSSRVLIDMTVSELESFESNPPLPVNSVGLPPSVNSSLSNAQVRVPTKLQPLLGQDKILMNPTQHGLTIANNGTVDYSSPFLDVARAFRSGGPSEVTTDPYNGYLRDDTPPRVVGVQSGEIKVGITVLDAENAEFRVEEFHFESAFCSQTPAVGDILQQPGVFAEVIAIPTPVQNKVVTDLIVRLVSYPSDWPDGALTWSTTGLGPTQFLAPYEGAQDAGKAACFVTVTPLASSYPEQPTTGISSTASFLVRFNEPMDPGAMNAFDSVTVTRNPVPQGNYDYIVGDLLHSIDLHKFQFLPDLPFDHDLGQTEDYFINLVPGAVGPSDLAGNDLAEAFPQIGATIDATATPSNNGGRVSFFTSADEEYPIGSEVGDGEAGTLPEWGGQHIFLLTRGVIQPRPVVHFQGIVDRNNNPFIGGMTSTTTGQQTPLSNFGSKAQLVWRYMDMGFELYKQIPPPGDMKWDVIETHFNLDVEGLSWAPFGGGVVVDSYDKFEIRLNHTRFFPDEGGFPASGLVEIYDNNFLTPTNDPQRIVHERFLGYDINPGDIYVVNQTLKLIPFPMNVQVDPEEYRYYTWRDTSIRERGGPDGSGAPSAQYYTATGQAPPCVPDAMGNCPPAVGCIFNPLYYPGELQTVALPMLLEFRCWPDDGAIAINRFDTSIAPSPVFRAHSTGGIDQQTQHWFIEPDLETRANGGYDPTSVPPGAPTPGTDAEVYLGAADFVTRVSRSHSVWFGAVDPASPQNNFTNPSYNPPTVVPGLLDQPLGTSVQFGFRGATAITPKMNFDPGNWFQSNEALTMANELDLYGDHYEEAGSACDGSFTHNRGTELNAGIAFKNGVTNWSSSVGTIAGSQYYQVRITWISNPQTGLTPELTAFAITWAQN